MRTFTRLTLLLLSATLSGLACADGQGFYLGGNYAFINLGEDSQRVSTSDMGNLELTGGYKYRDWAGLELRLGTGVRAKRDELGIGAPAGSTHARHETDQYQSIYYRAELVNNEARLYFLVGYTSLKMTSRYYDGEQAVLDRVSRSASGPSYGIGVGFRTENDMNINVEYRLLADTDDEQFGALSLGFDYRF
jgi:opacity protein-like surface antigen